MRSRLRESASDQNQNSMRSQNPRSPHSVGDSRLPLASLVVKDLARPEARSLLMKLHPAPNLIGVDALSSRVIVRLHEDTRHRVQATLYWWS